MPVILDHLVVVAPTLGEGRELVEGLLGVAMFAGGRHNELGTHNALLRIGDDVFLEVIALDPEARHTGPRVFGIGDQQAARADWEAGRRLQTWVARTAGSAGLDAILAEHAPVLGEAKRVTRNERVWRMSIPPGGALPLGGAAPTVVDYEPGMVPARRMPETGCTLLGLTIATPDAAAVRTLLEQLDVQSPQGPVEVEEGPAVHLTARIATPRGVVELS